MSGPNGQAGTPAGGQENAGNGKAGGNAGEHEPAEYVTLAGDDDEGDGEDAGDESGEGEGDEEGGQGEGEGEPERKPAGRRPSGAQRNRARIEALERENAALRGRLAPHDDAPAADEEGDDLKEPKESDFPNDYLAYDRALREYHTRKAIRDENARIAKGREAARANAANEARQAGYNVRLEAVKDRIPDFDKVMGAAANMEIRDDVRDLLLESSKGPLLAYHLAKNPSKVADLNRMSPAAAAKEIGSLEARIRGPQLKTTTKAKPPKPAPRGGGGGGTAPADPNKMTMDQYVAWRAKQGAGK